MKQRKLRSAATVIGQLSRGQAYTQTVGDFQFSLIRHGRTAPINSYIFSGLRHEHLTLEVLLNGAPFLNGLSCCGLNASEEHINTLVNDIDLLLSYNNIGNEFKFKELIFTALHWTDPLVRAWSPVEARPYAARSLHRQVATVLLTVELEGVPFSAVPNATPLEKKRLKEHSESATRYVLDMGYAVKDKQNLVLTDKGREYMESTIAVPV